MAKNFLTCSAHTIIKSSHFLFFGNMLKTLHFFCTTQNFENISRFFVTEIEKILQNKKNFIKYFRVLKKIVTKISCTVET